MSREFYQINHRSILEVTFSDDLSGLDKSEEYWLQLKYDDRKDIKEQLRKYDFDERIIRDFDNPYGTKKIVLASQMVIVHLAISSSQDIYQYDFMTFLVRPGLLVTMIDQSNDLLDNVVKELNDNPYEVKLDLNYIIYFMVNFVLQQSSVNIHQARTMVDNLTIELDENPDDLDISDIVDIKYKLHNLNNVVDDQYITLQSIPKLRWLEGGVDIDEEISKSVQKFSFLTDLTTRLEDNIRGSQQHYQLILQEKNNKKLNALTIIQSVFVPLTLVTGIYGMNFTHMPELNWTYGYFLILSIMLLVSALIIWRFKKNGWFN